MLHAWTWDDLLLARSKPGRTNIAILELLVLVLTVATWGHKWRGRRVHFHSDNEVTVYSVERRLTRNDVLLRLLRALDY